MAKGYILTLDCTDDVVGRAIAIGCAGAVTVVDTVDDVVTGVAVVVVVVALVAVPVAVITGVMPLVVIGPCGRLGGS